MTPLMMQYAKKYQKGRNIVIKRKKNGNGKCIQKLLLIFGKNTANFIKLELEVEEMDVSFIIFNLIRSIHTDVILGLPALNAFVSFI